ncbi:hypothetical protein Tco_1254426 [Tanacetum coccineum]
MNGGNKEIGGIEKPSVAYAIISFKKQTPTIIRTPQSIDSLMESFMLESSLVHHLHNESVLVDIPLVDEWNAAMAISDVTHRSGLRFEGGEKDDLRRRRACLFISFLMGNGYDV